MWRCKPTWHCKYCVILESEVKFGKTYMKMSKYENSVFPYSLHSNVNLPAWRPKYTNDTFALRQWLSKEKVFFSKLHDKCCQNWQNPSWIVNIQFCEVIVKIGTCLFVNSYQNVNFLSRTRNSMVKNKKSKRTSFIFTFQKKFHLQFFHKFLTKGNS